MLVAICTPGHVLPEVEKRSPKGTANGFLQSISRAAALVRIKLLTGSVQFPAGPAHSRPI
jgi:hypothetical protein